MHAIVVKKPGGVKQLAFRKVKLPEPKAQEIRVNVHAFSINHLDLLQREGKYPPPKGASPLLGVDIAGTVEKVGPQCKHFKVGDRVMCLLDGGGYAEYAIAHEDLSMPIPKNLSFIDAAAIPEVFLAAYQTLFMIGEIQPLQKVLIHAGSSGVGSAAIQLVKEAGAEAYATASSLDKLEFCLNLGAQAVFNYKQKNLVEKVIKQSEGHGVDLIIDFGGANLWKKNLEMLSHGGCLILMATLGGSKVENLDLKQVMSKWITITGSTLRSRSLEYKKKLVKEFSTFALWRFQKRKLHPIIFDAFSWKEIQKAHAMLESGTVMGKLVIFVER